MHLGPIVQSYIKVYPTVLSFCLGTCRGVGTNQKLGGGGGVYIRAPKLDPRDMSFRGLNFGPDHVESMAVNKSNVVKPKALLLVYSNLFT